MEEKKANLQPLTHILNFSTKLHSSTGMAEVIENKETENTQMKKEWLREALDNMNLGSNGSYKKNSTFIRKIIEKSKKEELELREIEEVNEILDHFSEICEDIYKAIEFYQVGGFDLVCELMDISGLTFKSEVLCVVSSVLQNNLSIQEKAFSLEFLQKLITIWRDFLESEIQISINAITAISSLIKNSTKITNAFLNLVEKECLIPRTLSSGNERCQAKCINLINNLMISNPMGTIKLLDFQFFSSLLLSEITPLFSSRIIDLISKLDLQMFGAILENHRVDRQLLKEVVNHLHLTKPSKSDCKILSNFASFI